MADQMTPEMFMNFVKTASEKDIKAQVQTAGVDPVLDGMFQAMQEHFLPDKAQGVDAVIQYVVTDEGREYGYTLAIKDGQCALKKEKVGNAKVTLTIDLVSFLKLMCGAADGMTLYMSGKLGVAGDYFSVSGFPAFLRRLDTGPGGRVAEGRQGCVFPLPPQSLFCIFNSSPSEILSLCDVTCPRQRGKFFS